MEYTFCSENITELSKALLGVQKNLQPAIKDATNPFCKNRYATLNSVMDSCRSALLENGILLTQYPVPVEGENLGLVTKLIHAESGQYQASLAIIPLAKPDPQAMGSAFTYGRRYAISAMLGITAEEDDDGNAASNPKSYQVAKPRTSGNPQTASRKGNRIPLSTLLAELGLEDLTSCYRQLLQTEYGCQPEKMTSSQYEEQKAMLQSCKSEPLKLRDFMRALHEYK